MQSVGNIYFSGTKPKESHDVTEVYKFKNLGEAYEYKHNLEQKLQETLCHYEQIENVSLFLQLNENESLMQDLIAYHQRLFKIDEFINFAAATIQTCMAIPTLLPLSRRNFSLLDVINIEDILTQPLMKMNDILKKYKKE